MYILKYVHQKIGFLRDKVNFFQFKYPQTLKFLYPFLHTK